MWKYLITIYMIIIHLLNIPSLYVGVRNISNMSSFDFNIVLRRNRWYLLLTRLPELLHLTRSFIFSQFSYSGTYQLPNTRKIILVVTLFILLRWILSHHGCDLYTFHSVAQTTFTFWLWPLYFSFCCTDYFHILVVTFILFILLHRLLSHFGCDLYTFHSVAQTTFTFWLWPLYFSFCCTDYFHILVVTFILFILLHRLLSHFGCDLYTFHSVAQTTFTFWLWPLYFSFCCTDYFHILVVTFTLFILLHRLLSHLGCDFYTFHSVAQ